MIGSNIFLIANSSVDHHIKDYYAHCYGIRVLDKMEIHDFFAKLNEAMPEAESRQASSINNIKEVIFKGSAFNKDYLKIENTFFEIISSLAAIGISINDVRVVKMLGDIINKKTELTTVPNAWDQYEHLARWLIYLASILELSGTSIEKIYLTATVRSMNTMRKDLYTGYSWHAYTSWKFRWSTVIASNRALIRKHIETETTWPDALDVVRSA